MCFIPHVWDNREQGYEGALPSARVSFFGGSPECFFWPMTGLRLRWKRSCTRRVNGIGNVNERAEKAAKRMR